MSDELRQAATEMMAAIVKRNDRETNPKRRAAAAAMYEVCRQWIDANPADDGYEIDEAWLRSVGFAPHSLRMSILLAPVHDEAAIVELSISPDDDDWMVSLLQGVPDDQHRTDDHVLLTSKAFKTRGDVRKLCAALGIALKEGTAS